MIFKGWHQTVELLKNSQIVQIEAALQAKISKNFYHNEWGYIFEKSERVNIHFVKVNGKEAKYTFRGNTLKINIGELSNNQKVKIEIKYQVEKNENRNKYFLQDYAIIPGWIKSAKGSLRVIIPKSYIVCSRHPSMRKNGNQYYWEGKIPGKGISELFKITPRKARWELVKSISFEGAEIEKGIDFSFPVFFKTGNIKILKYDLSSNIKPTNKKEINSYHHFSFSGRSCIDITLKAVVETGQENTDYNLPLKKSFVYLKPKYEKIIKNLANSILDKKNWYNLPDYIRIAQWTNNYLKCDMSFRGKELDLLQIVQEKRGVCQHFSKLYIALCRSIGIPAVEITGHAYSFDKSISSMGWGWHTWALVNIQNKWIPVDPTWNITNGVLPVSYIPFYFNHLVLYNYKAQNYYGNLSVNYKKIKIKEK